MTTSFRPTAAGYFVRAFVVTVIAAVLWPPISPAASIWGWLQIALNPQSNPLRIVTILPLGVTGNPYSASLTVSGGKAPYSWSGVGLPGGLTISGESLSGSVATITQVTISVTVRDRTNKAASANLPLRICEPLRIQPLPPMQWLVGVPVNVQLQATGGADRTVTPPACLPGLSAL